MLRALPIVRCDGHGSDPTGRVHPAHRYLAGLYLRRRGLRARPRVAGPVRPGRLRTVLRRLQPSTASARCGVSGTTDGAASPRTWFPNRGIPASQRGHTVSPTSLHSLVQAVRIHFKDPTTSYGAVWGVDRTRRVAEPPLSAAGRGGPPGTDRHGGRYRRRVRAPDTRGPGRARRLSGRIDSLPPRPYTGRFNGGTASLDHE